MNWSSYEPPRTTCDQSPNDTYEKHIQLEYDTAKSGQCGDVQALFFRIPLRCLMFLMSFDVSVTLWHVIVYALEGVPCRSSVSVRISMLDSMLKGYVLRSGRRVF